MLASMAMKVLVYLALTELALKAMRKQEVEDLLATEARAEDLQVQATLTMVRAFTESARKVLMVQAWMPEFLVWMLEFPA